MLKLVTNKQIGYEKKTDIIKKVNNIAYSLVEKIDKLLDISRLQTGNVKPIKKNINAYNLAEEHLDSLRYLANKKGIDLRNDLAKDMLIFADNTLFGQVINNLISNAIKFSSEGDAITIFCHNSASATVAVKDTGKGINASTLPDLFRHDMVTSTLGTAGEKGTGMGLPYCKDIMEAHGGSLEVESVEGKGSTFYVNLPED